MLKIYFVGLTLHIIINSDLWQKAIEFFFYKNNIWKM